MVIFELCAASLLLVVLASYALQPVADARRRLPPGPRPLPVVGNLLDVGDSPHRAFARLADSYGPLMSVRLGAVYAVVASSPETAREILQKRNGEMASRRSLDAWRVLDHPANSMIALPARGKWRALRQHTAAGMLGPRRLAEQRAVREEEVRDMARRVAALADQADDGAAAATVAVAREASAAMIDVICRAMFSEELDPAVVAEITDVTDEAAVLSGAPNVSDFFPALAAADLQGIRHRAEKLVTWLYSIVDEQVGRRRRSRAAGEARKNDLLDVFLDNEGEVQEEGWAINQDTIRGLFMELVLGGSSVPTTVEWAMAELLQSPQTMKKAQEELRTVLHNKPHMEESDIAQLPYLQAVVNETLRLHPPVPFASGLAEETLELHGYNVPKGASAFVNIWAICRNAEVWDEPDKFMPERFLQNEIDFSGTDFEFIPFSTGRRICPGLNLSSKLVPLMLASLLHEFDWTLPEDAGRNGIDMSEKFGLVLSMAAPLRAAPKKAL